MKVSIVIPVYNVELYLKECIDSVINQTLQDIEIIAVNDGSTDGSLEILQSYEKEYSNFKIINKKNGGLSSARNVGLDIATGEYIYFLDSDDYVLYNNIIEYCYGIASDHYLDIITFDLIEMFDNNGRIIPTSRDCSRKEKIESKFINGEEFFYTTHKKHVFDDYVPTVIYRTNYLKENNFRFYEDRIYEDGIFNLVAFIKAPRILYIPYQFYFRRIRENSITTVKITETNIYSLMKNIKSIDEFYINNKNTLKKQTKDSLAEAINDYLTRIEFYRNVSDIEPKKKNFIDQEIKELKESLSINLKEMGYIKVSVIITVYNAEKYLNQCLDSVVNQNLNGIEVIAINCGSTDNSGNILKEYEQKYKSFKIIHKENIGTVSAQNIGLDIATGELIYFLDSKDYIARNNVDYWYNLMKDHCLDIITFDSIDIHREGINLSIDTNSSRKNILESVIKSGEDFYNEFTEKNSYKGSIDAYLYRREFLIKNNIRFKPGIIDAYILFNTYAFIKAEKVLYLPYDYYFRRVMKDSCTTDSMDEKNMYSQLQSSDELKKIYLENKQNLKEKTKENLIKYI